MSNSQLSQSSITSDSRRLISIQTVVLSYYYDIAKEDEEFAKQILRFCKNNSTLYSIRGFMCIILLNLAGLDYIKDQILDFLSTCIVTCYKDSKLMTESSFIRHVSLDNFDMDALLLNAIKYCCISEREFISTNLLELAFLLIKAGLPRSKIVSLKASSKNTDDALIGETCNNDVHMAISQKVGQVGIQMAIQIFKRLVPCRQLILDHIEDFILKESHKSSVFVYLELFADLIGLMPLEVLRLMESSCREPIFELLYNFPHEVALGLVNALLPLVRLSPNLRDQLIFLVLGNILSGRCSVRLICVESALILLKYLRITLDQFGFDDVLHVKHEPVLLTQCSQFACTQIAAESAPVPVDNYSNDEICGQILQIIDESCRQHPDTKAVTYRGLVRVIERNFYFSGKVVLFFLEKLRQVMNESPGDSPSLFIMEKIFAGSDKECQILENVSVLVSCLAEAVRHCRTSMPPNDILTGAIRETKCLSDAVAQAEQAIGLVHAHLCTCDVTNFGTLLPLSEPNKYFAFQTQCIDLYDVVLVHAICSDQGDMDDLEKLLNQKEATMKTLNKKNHRDGSSPVLSLPTVVKSMRYVFEFLLQDQENITDNAGTPPTQRSRAPTTELPRIVEMSREHSNGNFIVPADETGSSPSTLFHEKACLYLLHRAVQLVRQIGSPDYRITHGNRKDTCLILSEFVRLCLGYYVTCLCSEKVDSFDTLRRQIMHQCLVLYCLAIDRVMQFCSKVIKCFLEEMIGLRIHIRSIQVSLGRQNCSSSSQRTDVISMGSFVKLHKFLVARILVLSCLHLHGDVDFITRVTINIAIFGGMEDSRQAWALGSISGYNQINTSMLRNLNSWTTKLLKSSKLCFKINDQEVNMDIGLCSSQLCQSLFSMCLTTGRIVLPDFLRLLKEVVLDVCYKIGSHTRVTPKKPKHPFELLSHPAEILADVISSISLVLDDMEWLLTKWKYLWAEGKQQRKITQSQLSLLNSSSSELANSSLKMIRKQNCYLLEQCYVLCCIMSNILQCSINNVPRLYSIVNLTTKLFNLLTSFTKQYIILSKKNLGSLGIQFEKLVNIACGKLPVVTSKFIIYFQQIEGIVHNTEKPEKKNSEIDGDLDESNNEETYKKDKELKNILDIQICRTGRDIRLIPNLVFSVEQYQRYTIQLHKLSKFNLTAKIKVLNCRDIRIDPLKVQESLDMNATVYITDDDDEPVVENDEPVVNDEPVIGSDESVVENNEPVVGNNEPREEVINNLQSPPRKKQRGEKANLDLSSL